MIAIILAAGRGRRLGVAAGGLPKCLLEFGGRTLLRRHLELLKRRNIARVVLGTGYRQEAIEAELQHRPAGLNVESVYNPDYALGSVVTLWALRDYLRAGDEVLLMDADVLCDHRLLDRLIDSRHCDCVLLDRDFEAGEEPVKLCVKDGRPVEFRKNPPLVGDYCGESVGFFRLAAETAARLAATAQRYIDSARTGEPYEEALRDVLLAHPQRFGFEDITGLPWIEIDFAEDIDRAKGQILPALTEP